MLCSVHAMLSACYAQCMLCSVHAVLMQQQPGIHCTYAATHKDLSVSVLVHRHQGCYMLLNVCADTQPPHALQSLMPVHKQRPNLETSAYDV